MADLLAPVRAAVTASLAGLEECVTVRVARERMAGAIDALESQLQLLNEFERPRQEATKVRRAEAARKQEAEDAKATAAKNERIARRRKARQ